MKGIFTILIGVYLGCIQAIKGPDQAGIHFERMRPKIEGFLQDFDRGFGELREADTEALMRVKKLEQEITRLGEADAEAQRRITGLGEADAEALMRSKKLEKEITRLDQTLERKMDASFYINCGGEKDFTDANGIVWQADRDFTESFTYTPKETKNGLNEPFLSKRYAVNFSYRFPVIAGNYRVTLHFAEVFYKDAGIRIFSVNINGQPKLQKFDIVAAAGGAFKRVDRSFDVYANGKIYIDFVSN